MPSLPLLLPILFLASFAASAGVLAGRVVGVADGDTLTLLDGASRQHKVRLAGIDAPEKRQDFGQRSKESLSFLAFGRQVMVETSKTDRYGRAVGKIMVDGRDVNLEQVRRGMAWHYKAYEREQSPPDRHAYAAAESAARAARAGLWAMPGPAAPWVFRRTKNAVMSANRHGHAGFALE